MAINLIYDPAYLKHDTGMHPENRQRLEAILSTLHADEDLSKNTKEYLLERLKSL